MKRFDKHAAIHSFIEPLFVYASIIFILVYLAMPYFEEVHKSIIISVGIVAAWRYGLMVTNYIRAYIFAKKVYPNYQNRIAQIQQKAKFPQHLYIIIPSYKEDFWVTTEVFHGILSDLSLLPCPATLVVATATMQEDSVIRNVYESFPSKQKIALVFQHQQEGKRIALGHMLRYVAKDVNSKNIQNSITAFMDGDTYIPAGTFNKLLPFFALETSLGAVTTNEIAFIHSDSIWYKEWFNLKFAQRHVLFQSQSLSKKVMTLTGRFSVYRTSAIIEESFIATMENDIIIDPSYGKFRFLMGDDKTSWYLLLKKGWDMLYLPDVLIYSLESRDAPFLEVSQTLPYRWYGNTLRNNKRARQLKNIPFFIKYLLYDQIFLMWTSIIGLIGTILLSIFVHLVYLPIYLAWIIFVRLAQMGVYVYFGHRVTLETLPIMLYSQWAGAYIKIKSFFHLSDQKWSKSDEVQKADQDADLIKYPFFRFFSKLRMSFYVTVFLLFILIPYTGIVTLPKSDFFDVNANIPSNNTRNSLVLTPNDGKDDAHTLNAIIANAQDGAVITLPKGTLDIFEPIKIKKSNITIQGNQTQLLSHLYGKKFHDIILIEGKRGQYIGKTLENAYNQTSLQVQSKTSIQPNTLMLLEQANDENYIQNILGAKKWNKPFPKLRSEIIKVLSTSHSKLTLEYQIKSYIDDGASLYLIKPIENVTLQDFTLDSIYKSEPYAHIYKNTQPKLLINGIHLLYTSNITLKNIVIKNSGSSPLYFERSYGCYGENIAIDGAINKGKKGNGYLRFNKSFHNSLYNITVKGIRHIVFQWASAYNRIEHLYSEVDINFHGGSSHDNVVRDVTFHVDSKKHKWGKVFTTPNTASWAPPDLKNNIVLESH